MLTTPSAFQNARSFDAALDGLAEIAQGLGFDAIDYGFMPRARTLDGGYNAPQIAWRHWPQRCIVGWARFCREDPFLYAAYPRTVPLDWREVRGAAWLSATQKQALAYVESTGFADGISVPIHLPEGAFAFVTAVSRAPEGRWRLRQSEVRDALFVLAHDFHAAVAPHLGLDTVPRDVRLSARECAVLTLAATGLSAARSAHHLQRSVETVRNQRRSAMGKLGAHTMAQAVAQAVRLGLIGR